MGSENPIKTESSQPPKSGLVKLAFVGGVSVASLLAGFGATIAICKKRDPLHFTKGLEGIGGSRLESGSSLAFRALGWGSIYALTGVSVISLIAWKFGGIYIKNLKDSLPNIPRNEPEGKSDFKTVREVLAYIINESDKSTEKKS